MSDRQTEKNYNTEEQKNYELHKLYNIELEQELKLCTAHQYRSIGYNINITPRETVLHFIRGQLFHASVKPQKYTHVQTGLSSA